ncbi:uncharacterized protein Z518_08191 [Rhinocladiella mackenziei CBS 650.93]|uniref:HhH-GPD domain-containing protein n=1 Tax=Rhinocladiella mackenziei CBS 650.93 TaxID=1442369 RepID=A0A0D2FJV7_9EURO|nr:uncharacterized protein Z518_08191 [Rhinocladiella mackenziei CBS 650.93]KIX02252.1 hypothetical protein Z518_08191 [Rhinocladiella mackenziei CBS 650.93]
MVLTRSQQKSQGSRPKSHREPQVGDKRSHSKALETKATGQDEQQKKTEHKSQKKTATKISGDSSKLDGNQKMPRGVKQIIEKLIQEYGDLPLHDTILEQPDKAMPETVLALLLNAILSATRISHHLASKTTDLVIKAEYHKIHVLKKSTWEDRTDVLTEGGYTHYRERTAAMMGELADTIEEEYDGDLNTILQRTSEDPKQIRSQLKTIKGVGDVGVDIFFDTAQHVWPCLAPFVDPRSLKTAENIGLGNDVQVLWEEVGRKPELMCRLACALMRVRLERREAEFRI